jgi:hypothetical protein
MPNAFRSRLTFANVTSVTALVFAMAGGAYALTGIPDRGGVYHGCVATSGALRVVAKASSCRKTKTVKRGNRRVRIPGESAIAWNQQGRAGANGTSGLNGLNGANGATRVVVRTGTNVLNAGLAGRATAICVGNERAVGGSANTSNGALNDWIMDSEPTNATGNAATSGATPVGWSTQMHGDAGAGARQIIAYVICASP